MLLAARMPPNVHVVTGRNCPPERGVIEPHEKLCPAPNLRALFSKAFPKGNLIIDGEPAFEANRLTHMVINDWVTFVKCHPSMGRRMGGRPPETMPPPNCSEVAGRGGIRQQIPVLVSFRWLEASVAAGRALPAGGYYPPARSPRPATAAMAWSVGTRICRRSDGDGEYKRRRLSMQEGAHVTISARVHDVVTASPWPWPVHEGVGRLGVAYSQGVQANICELGRRIGRQEFTAAQALHRLSTTVAADSSAAASNTLVAQWRAQQVGPLAEIDDHVAQLKAYLVQLIEAALPDQARVLTVVPSSSSRSR